MREQDAETTAANAALAASQSQCASLTADVAALKAQLEGAKHEVAAASAHKDEELAAKVCTTIWFLFQGKCMSRVGLCA